MRPAGAAWRTGGAARGALFDAALIGAAAALLLLPSLLHGPPTGHDYPHHRAWIEAFTAQLSLAEPYPRWLGGLWFGAGGADFFFYAPLAYWLAGAVRGLACPGCAPATLLVAVGLVGLAASGLGFRALGLRFAGRGPALAGALVYMALPYHLGADWYDRLALAEFTALAVLPWQLAAFVDCARGRAAGVRLAVLSALLVLGHLPTAVVVAPGYLLLLIGLRPRPGWRALGRCALAGAVGPGLAAAYWYPAVSLLDTVRADQLGGTPVALVNLLMPVNFAREPYLEALWPPLAALSAVTLAILLARPKEASVPGAAVAGLVVLVWVLVTPLSMPLWRGTPLVLVQYPWRFLALADVAFGLAAVLGAALVAQPAAGRLRRWLAGAGLAGMVAVAALEHPGLSASRSALPNPQAPVLAGAFEWLPRESAGSGDLVSYTEWRRIVEAARALAPPPAVRLAGAGSAEVVEQAPRRLVFEADLPAAGGAVIHRTYWRFWRLENLDTGTEIALGPTEGFPLVSATLPPGRARYRLELPVLPEERTGSLLSALSLAVLLAWGWLARPRRRS